MPKAVDAPALQQQLEYLLGPVLSARRNAAPLAQAIATLDHARQAFVLHWIEVIDRSNYELAYRFAAAAPAALECLDETAARAWLLEALDRYDREGLHSASSVLQDHAAFGTAADHAVACNFEECAGVLRLFVRGLGGRTLQVEAGPRVSTDTDTLFLPARIASMPSKKENFNIFKWLSTLLWAQNRFGSHHHDLASACAAYPEPGHAADLLMHLEMLRLTPRIATLVPGVARLLENWLGKPDPRCLRLQQPGATTSDSLVLLEQLYGRLEPPRLPWRVQLHAQASARREARVEHERGELAALLAQLLESQRGPGAGEDDDAGRFSIEHHSNAGDGTNYTLRLDGQPLQAPPAVAERIESLLQDLGEIPDDY
ncbi:MAG: hypothetical protein FJY44_11405, partial [Betaproteobacteria bacterium]|nr:hypothetical protein [Betaproteobacteria bacterium]